MKYTIVAVTKSGERIVTDVDATSAYDAVDVVSDMMDLPEDIDTVDAYPVF